MDVELSADILMLDGHDCYDVIVGLAFLDFFKYTMSS